MKISTFGSILWIALATGGCWTIASENERQERETDGSLFRDDSIKYCSVTCQCGPGQTAVSSDEGSDRSAACEAATEKAKAICQTKHNVSAGVTCQRN